MTEESAIRDLWQPKRERPAAQVDVSVRLDIEQLAKLPPANVTAIMAGVAEVLAAQGKGK